MLRGPSLPLQAHGKLPGELPLPRASAPSPRIIDAAHVPGQLSTEVLQLPTHRLAFGNEFRRSKGGCNLGRPFNFHGLFSTCP